jgi:hypothetical protein
MVLLAAAGLVMVVFGLVAYYATDQISAFSLGNLVLGSALLLSAGVLQGGRVEGFRGALSRRLATRWLSILIGTIAVVVLANTGLVNWGAQIDLTRDRLYTPSDQTRKVLEEIDGSEGESFRLLLFVDAPLSADAEPLVRAYAGVSARLEVQRLRLDHAPLAAQPHAIDEPALVACRGARCEWIGYPSEGSVTGALIRLLAPRQIYAYFLLGHGEIDLADESDDGFGLIRDVLRGEGIEPKGWIGPSRISAPEDADLVIIGAPERDLLPAEIDALDRYLGGGGRLLALVEPGVETNLHDLLRRWGFGLPDGIVADRATSPLLESPRPVTLVVQSFSPDHPVTRPFSPRTMLLLPTTRSIRALRKPAPEDRMRELVYSSPHGWLETDVTGAVRDRPIRPDPDEVQGREIPIAAAGRYPRGDREARILVIGDRDFVRNRLLYSLYNRDLLLNGVHWLVEQDRRVAIRDKFWTPRQDPLTPQETLTFFYFFAFALPELLLLLGIHAWYRQRS